MAFQNYEEVLCEEVLCETQYLIDELEYLYVKVDKTPENLSLDELCKLRDELTDKLAHEREIDDRADEIGGIHMEALDSEIERIQTLADDTYSLLSNLPGFVICHLTQSAIGRLEFHVPPIDLLRFETELSSDWIKNESGEYHSKEHATVLAIKEDKK